MKTILGVLFTVMFSTLASAIPLAAEPSCLGKAEAPVFSDYYEVSFPKAAQGGLTYKDVQEVVPTDMIPTENAVTVVNKIGDRLMQNWLKSEAVKASAMGKTASTLENAMKAEVKVEKSKPEGVEHKFSFQFLALQALAKVEYSGWLNASVNYDARASQTGIELKEKVWNSKDLFINHTVTSIEEVSSMGLRWNW